MKSLQGSFTVRDALRASGFGRALSEVFDDIGLLFQQEIKLAKTEVSLIVADQVRAVVYMMAAGLFGLVTLLLLCQAAVFALINMGFSGAVSCLIVAAAAMALALIAFLVARSHLSREKVPTRAMNQVKQDIATAKESLS
jgi:hypothetical protein